MRDKKLDSNHIIKESREIREEKVNLNEMIEKLALGGKSNQEMIEMKNRRGRR